MKKIVHVVAGIVYNEQGEFLLSSRPAGKPYAGYWEFAGGKVEDGESQWAALQREFLEELGISILAATPWLSMFHQYEHAHVYLRFFKVAANQWQGQLQAREAQQWAWQRAGDFSVSPMLPANQKLLTYLAIADHFSGNLTSGLQGENGYFIAPYHLAEPTDSNIMLNMAQHQKLAQLPTNKSTIWLIIDDETQFYAAPEVDAFIWCVKHKNTAQQLYYQLQKGVSYPIIVMAIDTLYQQFADKWRSVGAQAVVLLTE